MSLNDKIFVDSQARTRIENDLDSNLIVEAAAGTGKTTAMVGRMVQLVLNKKCDISRIAAVTFTRKAAAELKARFRVRLEQLAAQGNGDMYLDNALDRMESCFIGTIHSFCMKMLRERPVEAGVNLSFVQADDADNRHLRQRAWENLVSGRAEGCPDIKQLLAGDQIELADLEEGFFSYTQYPDIENWPVAGDKFQAPDIDKARSKLRNYLEHIDQLPRELKGKKSSTDIIHLYSRIKFRVAGRGIENMSSLCSVLELFEVNKPSMNRDSIKTLGKNRSDEEKDAFSKFSTEIAQPVLDYWRSKRYEKILQIYSAAATEYNRLRFQEGKLNYQDLLMKTAALLRDKPNVREYFSKRFSRILVDEFQDTDPIQAEIIMFLVASDSTVTDWRKCTPRPGSLFIVGDPKQSIYRFRRADIHTYEEVKRLLTQNGKSSEQVLHLSTNFRTSPELIDWVNSVFDPSGPEENEETRFPAGENDFSPAYIPLAPGRPVTGDRFRSPVRVIRYDKDESKSNEYITEHEPDMIARYIRHALDGNLELPRFIADTGSYEYTAASEDDFLIVTWKTKNLKRYAEALDRYGIAHEVTGGTMLNELRELNLLLRCLEIISRPDNPVPLVGILTGELYGISDRELYEYYRHGRCFSLLDADIPADREELKDNSVLAAILELKEMASLFRQCPAPVALDMLVERLGFRILASSGWGGEMRLGSLEKALEILKRDAGRDGGPLAMAERLRELIEAGENYDGISAVSGQRRMVRIMNLHKVKGLEAPVVFLADPTGGHSFKPSFHVERERGRGSGYLKVEKSTQGYHKPVLAYPVGWQNFSEREEMFTDGEKKRLLYVAATRAGVMLVISDRESRKNYNAWSPFSPMLESLPGLEIPTDVLTAKDAEKERPETIIDPLSCMQRKTNKISSGALNTYENWQARLFPLTMQNFRPKSLNGPVQATEVPSERIDSLLSEEQRMLWGKLIHKLLDLNINYPDADINKAALNLIEHFELDPALQSRAVSLIDSVKSSEIWKRAVSSTDFFTELPFSIAGKLIDDSQDNNCPSIVRGAIDLVFSENGHWIIVDYKTEKINISAGMIQQVEKYVNQLNVYVKAWQLTTGMNVSEAGLYFIEDSVYVPFEKYVDT